MEKDQRYARYTREGGTGPDLGLLIEALVTDARAYVDAQRELIGLNASEKGGRLLAIVLVVFVLAVMGVVVLVMLSIAMALWLGGMFGDLSLGFLAMGGVHLALTGVFYLAWRHFLRERVILAFINAVHGTQ